jgi:hypothetical protein
LLEPKRQPIPVRPILRSPWHHDLSAGNALEAEFEEWTVMDVEQPISDMDAEISIDADQVGVERRVMDFGQRQPIRDDGLTKLLVGIDNDVSGIKQARLGQFGNHAPSVVGSEDGIPK